MTIEILTTRIIETEETTTRYVEIAISDNGNTYLWSVGGLPAEGDLQTILDARETELLQAASNTGRQVDLYELTLKQVLKAFALVVMDEINILRQRANLQPRQVSQIDDAIKAKLKGLG